MKDKRHLVNNFVNKMCGQDSHCRPGLALLAAAFPASDECFPGIKNAASLPSKASPFSYENQAFFLQAEARDRQPFTAPFAAQAGTDFSCWHINCVKENNKQSF